MTAERNPPADDSFLAQPLAWLTEQLLRAPGKVLVGCGALALIGVVLAINGLEFQTNSLDLLNRQSDVSRRWLNYVTEFGDQDDVIVVVRGTSPADFGPAVDELAADLRQHKQYFDLILARRDLSALKSKGLHFSSRQDLERLAEFVQQAQRLVERGPAATDPITNLRHWNGQLKTLGPVPAEHAADLLRDYTELAGGLAPSVQTGGTALYPLPPLPPLPQGTAGNHADYLRTIDQQAGLIYLRLVPERTGPAAALAQLRLLTAVVQRKYPSLKIELTGPPIQASADRQARGFDFAVCGVFSFVLVGLLFYAAFGNWREVVVAAVVLLVASGWSLGWITLFVGHLQALSMSFGMILLAFAVDFAIHGLTRYRAQRQLGLATTDALLQAMRTAGPGIVTAGTATAMAFFTAGFTEHVGLAEFGVVAGGSSVLCLLAALLVLPPLTLLIDETWPPVEQPALLPAGAALSLFHRLPQAMVPLGVGLALLLTAGATKLKFDHELPNISATGMEATSYAVSVCESREELETQRERFSQLPTVGRVEEIGSLAPEHDPVRARTIARIQEALVAMDRLPPPGEIDVEPLLLELTKAEERLSGCGLERTPAFAAVRRLHQQLAALSAAEGTLRLNRFRDNLRSELRQQLRPLAEISDPLSPTLNDLPRELTARFVGRSQRHLMKIYPRTALETIAELRQFLAETEAVDPLLTGHPVRAYYASQQLWHSYAAAGLMAVLVVVCIAYLEFQSLTHAASASTPLLVTSGTLLGLLGWWNIAFKPTHLMVLPLILALNGHAGMQLVHELRRQRGPFQLPSPLAVSLLLTATTILAVYGIWMLALDPSLQGLGRIITLAASLSVVTTLVFFPALLVWLTKHRPAADAEGDSTTAEATLVQPRRRNAA